ncbi:MAG: hypothetical protein ACR2QC_04025 [Gammaproteobacteria bacterium]
MLEVAWNALGGAWETFLLLGACVALFIYLRAERPSWHALAGIGCYATALVLMSLWMLWPGTTPDEVMVQYQVWTSGTSVALVMYLTVLGAFLMWPPRQGDALVHLIWLIVIFSEAWTAVMENINCNFWETDIPLELRTPEQMEMSVCERIYGWWYSYIPLALEICAMFYFVNRWRWAKRLTTA